MTLAVRAGGVGAAAAGLGLLCGLFLGGEAEAPPRPPRPRPASGGRAGKKLGVLRSARPGPAQASVCAVPTAPTAPTAPAAPADPRDLARALPGAEPAARLLALLSGTDDALATATAEALATTVEGRSVLLAHLSRQGAPGGVDLVCLEALARVGRLEDVAAVVPWARRGGAVGALGAWCVREICARERADAPEDLRHVVPRLEDVDAATAAMLARELP